jgi:hypothetical protein
MDSLIWGPLSTCAGTIMPIERTPRDLRSGYEASAIGKEFDVMVRKSSFPTRRFVRLPIQRFAFTAQISCEN